MECVFTHIKKIQIYYLKFKKIFNFIYFLKTAQLSNQPLFNQQENNVENIKKVIQHKKFIEN